MSPAPLGFPVGETAADPWDLLFDKAQKTRPPGVNDLVPFWVYEKKDGYKLVRHVPSLPLSRELERLKNLKNSLAAYRMVFGQPRQEDLLKYLQERVGSEIDPEELLRYRKDLRPVIE